MDINSLEQGGQMKSKGHLNLRAKIDLLKLTITVDFHAQSVFVSRVILHEINEILGKVSRFDQFRFGTEKSSETSNVSKGGRVLMVGVMRRMMMMMKEYLFQSIHQQLHLPIKSILQ